MSFLRFWVGQTFLNERADINLQFYPLYLVFIYLLSSKLFEINVLGKLFKLVNTLSLVILFLVNSLFLGSLYQDYKSYNGNILSNSDIPLIYKIEVVDYIYEDLEKSDSINSLNIYYDLGGDGFDWIPGFGKSLHRIMKRHIHLEESLICCFIKSMV